MNQHAKGQSITEFLVCLLFFVPVLLMLPTLANMLSVQTTAHKASRYVAWERTAYSTAGLKDAESLSDEIEQRFLVGAKQGFGQSSVATRASWFDFGRKDLSSTQNANMSILELGTGNGVVMNIDSSRSATSGNQNASAWMADRGGRENPENAVQLNTLQVASLSIPLMSSMSLLEPTRPINAWRYEVDPDANSTPPVDPVAQESRYYIASSSALVADGWSAVSEQMFHDRVAGMNNTARRFQNYWENGVVSTGLSFLGFREIGQRLFVNSGGRTASMDMVDPQQSLNIPDNLKEYR